MGGSKKNVLYFYSLTDPLCGVKLFVHQRDGLSSVEIGRRVELSKIRDWNSSSSQTKKKCICSAGYFPAARPHLALNEPAELGYILCYNTYVPTGRTAKAVDFMQKILTPLPSPNQTKSKTKLEKNARRAWRLLTR